jgi:citronellol/citronellal dehydrogenase
MSMPTTREDLTGRVAIITGSSRGIGREMALALAAAGVHVVVTGKSEESTDKLPGSIHTVVAEIEARGGQALAVKVDVRDEEQVARMIEQTIERFGRLDILINNAGALWWKPILDTPVKRFDLMWDINVRASFIASYYALPHLIKNGWGHVINCSMPIVTEATPGFVAYNATKMGMTRVAIGLAAEHAKDNIAGNALWPATPIESQATINWGMGDQSTWRTPQILVDAMLEIVTSPPAELTGRQLIDEELLRERGWSEERLDGYWLTGKRPDNPVWIDGRPGAGAHDLSDLSTK